MSKDANAVIFARHTRHSDSTCNLCTVYMMCMQTTLCKWLKYKVLLDFGCFHCVCSWGSDPYFTVRIQQGSLILNPVIDHGTLTWRALLCPQSTHSHLHHIHLNGGILPAWKMEECQREERGHSVAHSAQERASTVMDERGRNIESRKKYCCCGFSVTHLLSWSEEKICYAEVVEHVCHVFVFLLQLCTFSSKELTLFSQIC